MQVLGELDGRADEDDEAVLSPEAIVGVPQLTDRHRIVDQEGMEILQQVDGRFFRREDGLEDRLGAPSVRAFWTLSAAVGSNRPPVTLQTKSFKGGFPSDCARRAKSLSTRSSSEERM